MALGSHYVLALMPGGFAYRTAYTLGRELSVSRWYSLLRPSVGNNAYKAVQEY